MRIKHWAGYGCVNAKKLSLEILDNNTTKLVIQVSGDHEYGLHRDDAYDISNWIIKRFDKNFKGYHSITSMDIKDGYDGKTKQETCTYTVTYDN